MKTDFIHSDFLLESPLARTLYHEYVEGLPIADYHNHLVPTELASDRRFDDIGQLWVASDPYKHRAMRLHGECESVITGPATTREKFDAWARTLPHTLGNPLFHWSAMEMKNVFGLDEMPDAECASRVWDACNERLKEAEFSTMGILRSFGVKVLSTSDDLLDDVTVHSSVKGDIKVTPSLRADSILGFNPARIERLGSPKTLEEYLAAVDARLDAFSANGCRVADHALDDGWRFVLTDAETAAKLYETGEYSDVRLKSYVLGHLASEYASRGWAMLLHIGAQRFTNSRLRALVGPAGGYASIGNTCDIKSLCTFMDSQDVKGELPKTALFTLNPADNAVMSILSGSYSADGVESIVTQGPAWWWCDHALGIRNTLDVIASFGVVSRFIGMTTDSRSPLSFVRHDYFRRLLASYIAEKSEREEWGLSEKQLGEILKRICYENANEKIYRRKA